VCDIAIVCHITATCEMLYSLPVLEALRPGKQPKQTVVKNKTLIFIGSVGGLRGPHILTNI
jgi:hypothetical protein